VSRRRQTHRTANQDFAPHIADAWYCQAVEAQKFSIPRADICMQQRVTAVPFACGVLHARVWNSSTGKHYASPMEKSQSRGLTVLCFKGSLLRGPITRFFRHMPRIFSGCGGYLPGEPLRGVFIWGKLCLTDSSLSHIASSAQSRRYLVVQNQKLLRLGVARQSLTWFKHHHALAQALPG
jgi:hypothetical protein